MLYHLTISKDGTRHYYTPVLYTDKTTKNTEGETITVTSVIGNRRDVPKGACEVFLVPDGADITEYDPQMKLGADGQSLEPVA